MSIERGAIYTIAEVAARAGVTRQSVYRWAWNGLLPPLRTSPTIFDASAADEFIAARRK